MRLLCLDYEPSYEPADLYGFGSDVSCFDYDAVVWDPGRALASSYSTSYPGHYRGLPRLDDSSSVRSQADIMRRNREFEDFVNGGRTLIVIIRPPQRFYYDTGERTYSGTGRNRHTTVEVNDSDVWWALPSKISVVSAAGSNIRFVGPGEYSELWKNFKEGYRYEAIIDADGLVPLFKITGTDKTVGGVLRTEGGGRVILLPPMTFDQDGSDAQDEDEDEDREDREDDEHEEDEEDDENADHDEGAMPRSLAYQEMLCDLATRLQTDSDVEPLPAWAAQYRLASETELRKSVVIKSEEIEASRAELSAFQSDLDRLESRKRLISGTGRALEVQVRNVLEALGGEVVEPEPGRDDWRVRFPEGSAVVEVKGLKGSAGEKDAAQLEKWISNCYEETGVLPKGILVANGWRTQPLDDRTRPVFPDQMLSYCVSRNHCLISGLQLLGIWQEIEAQPGRAQNWRQLIMSTGGPLPGLEDWASIVEDASSLSSSPD